MEQAGTPPPKFDSGGAYWAGGKLWIDGSESKSLVDRCVDRGFLTRGVEVFKVDNRQFNKVHKRK